MVDGVSANRLLDFIARQKMPILVLDLAARIVCKASLLVIPVAKLKGCDDIASSGIALVLVLIKGRNIGRSSLLVRL